VTETNSAGLSSVQYWTLTGIAVAAFALVVVNIGLSMSNAEVRKEVNARQQYIDQSVQLGRFHNQLVQGLATLSARSGDEELRSVLASHGINFSVGEGAPEASPPAAGNAGQGGAQE
jgi:hypothetical protein